MCSTQRVYYFATFLTTSFLAKKEVREREREDACKTKAPWILWEESATKKEYGCIKGARKPKTLTLSHDTQVPAVGDIAMRNPRGALITFDCLDSS